jgi:hypothetical protein
MKNLKSFQWLTKGKLLVIVAVLAVVALLILGKNTPPATNGSQSTSESSSEKKYLEIKEFAIKMPLDEATNDLEYAFKTETVFGSGLGPAAEFTSARYKKLIEALPTEEEKAACTSSTLGSIHQVLYDPVAAGVVTDQDVVKIGDIYYVYTYPSTSCTDNQHFIDAATPMYEAVRKVAHSVEQL